MGKDVLSKKKETIITEKTTVIVGEETENNLNEIAPKQIGKLDMVIAFDTTGSMARYINDVREQVADLVPNLFKDNDDLRLSIVAFGDYCDMEVKGVYGDAYQCLPLTKNENDIIKFVRESKDTGGGDGDEFYELVIKKIVEETDWREGSTRSILLISDAEPHELGYTYQDYVVGNQIDWREEARKAASRGIKIDTVSINPYKWYEQISAMTNGVNVPFRSSTKTAELVRATTMARGSVKQRMAWDCLAESCTDREMREVYCSLKKERDSE